METEKQKWSELLKTALTEPGSVSNAYHAFHNYSLGNQMLALLQCSFRHIAPGPIASYNGWMQKGRHVRQGEKAIALYMPITGRKRAKNTTDDENDQQTAEVYTSFILRHNWFVLSQTEGAEYRPEPLPDWSKERALETLAITLIKFDIMNGNVLGYALPGRKLALNPLGTHQARTLFHEIAHILLGHCENGQLNDGKDTPCNLCEVEAESVALLCCDALGLTGADESRGYIQSWANGAQSIPEAICQRIFKVADSILKAGRSAIKTPKEELAELRQKLAAMEAVES